MVFFYISLCASFDEWKTNNGFSIKFLKEPTRILIKWKVLIIYCTHYFEMKMVFGTFFRYLLIFNVYHRDVNEKKRIADQWNDFALFSHKLCKQSGRITGRPDFFFQFSSYENNSFFFFNFHCLRGQIEKE